MNNNKNIFMRGNVMTTKCPSRLILQHLTNKWSVLVLVLLRQGTKRFGELRKGIDGISERMLTQTLHHLEQDKMIARQDFQTVPPRVEYSLTPLGQAAADRLYALVDWLEESLPDIERAQGK